MKVLHSVFKVFIASFTLLAFTSAYSQQIFTDPVVKVLSRTARSVNVAWPAFAGDVSHYVLERSVDARRFQEVTVIVSVFSNEEPYYEYTDRFKVSYAGPIYYRLRLEGLDGSVVYTSVTTLKAAQN